MLGDEGGTMLAADKEWRRSDEEVARAISIDTMAKMGSLSFGTALNVMAVKIFMLEEKIRQLEAGNKS